MWLLYALGLIFSSSSRGISGETMDTKALSSAVAQFSAKFCAELDQTESVVASPLSAEFVLALLALGTTDPAHSELLTTLGFSDDESIRSTFSDVSSKMRSIKGVTLNVANKVYLMDGPYDLEPKLKQDATKVFDAAIEKVDFNDAEAAVDTINKWVEGKTNNKIKDLLSSDSVDSYTRLVLVNALYFKGTWKKQFDPENTQNQPFHISSHTVVDVPMMYKEDDYAYGECEALGVQLLQIPYVGGQASMLIVLPTEIEGLSQVMSKLASGYDLMSEVEQMYTTKVQVSLPKFKIETEIDLVELLPKLGIESIFDPQNSGITKMLNVDEPLFVSKAVQKAFIEVNEEGAEAAAATAMGFVSYSAFLTEDPVKQFTADRPFLAVILVDGTPHFMATYYAKEE